MADQPATPSIRAWGSISPWLLAAGGYLALIVIFTWPLAVRLTSVLPHDTGDPMFGAYLFWWNAHTVPLTQRWWNAPFFWPTEGALGLSEHLLGVSVVSTPLHWAGVDPIAVYNIVFLLSFVLSALAMHALVFTLARRHDAAALAGLIFGFSPYRTAQISHVQMLWTFWMPLALLALHRYAQDGRRRWLVLFGAVWLGQATSNGYYLLFFPVLIACWIAWFLVSRRDLRRAFGVIAAGAIASIPLVPLLLAYERVHRRLALERSLTEIREFSADVTAFVTTAPSLWAWTRLSHARRAEQELFPGATAVVLILLAVAVHFWRARRRTTPHSMAQKIFAILACLLTLVAASALFAGPWQVSVGGARLLSVGNASKPLTIAIWCAIGAFIAGESARRALAQRSLFAFYVAGAALMYLCSLGPEPAFQGAVFWYQPPYAWLMQLPGYASIRVPARFAMLGTLCLAAAAGLALTRLTSGLPRRSSLAVGVCVCVLAVADVWIADLPLPAIPQRIRALERPHSTSAVVELPMGDVIGDLNAMYRSMYHGMPVVNGYGGFNPASFDVLKLAMDDGDTAALYALGAPLTVVVDPRGDDRQWKGFVSELAAADVDVESGHKIFTLPARPMESPGELGDRLVIQAATASAPVDLGALQDGDLYTRWDSESEQRGNEWLTFDLGDPHRVSGLMLAVGPAYGGHARALAIDVSNDGAQWTTVFEERGGARAVRGAQQDARLRPVTYAFAPAEARWIRARQIGHADRFHWSICEAAVFGR